MFKLIQLFTFIGFALAANVVVAQSGAEKISDVSADETVVQGKLIYEEKCVQCHGADGMGDGPAAERLNPRPRDFTRAKYKIRSTDSRELPTDEDLFNVITNGMPGTSMPAWDDLSADDRRNVVAYIKTFSKRFDQAGAPPKKLNLGDKVSSSDESVAQGRQVYEEIECSKCHGQEGRGDGPSALSLVDEWEYPIRPADLTESWTFRGGSSAEDIYKRFIAGLDGTPMPSIIGSFVMDEDIEEIQIKIEDEEELTDEEREKFEKAMAEVRVKSWHLANYVRSLAPEDAPEVEVVLESKLVEGELPQEIDDPRWHELERNFYPLVGQVILEPRNFTPSVDAVFVKSMYNEEEIAFLLTWDDPSVSVASRPEDTSASETVEEAAMSAISEQETPTIYDDAIAMQFPVKLSDKPDRPYFLMGDSRKGVYLWRWQASDSFDTEGQPNAISHVTEENAKGMTEVSEQPGESQTVDAKVVYSNGRYQLLARRKRNTDDKNDLQFEAGRFIPIAFFAWDGSSNESGSRCSVSTWYYLLLEEPASQKRFLYAPIAAVLAIAFQVLLMKNVRKRAKA
ncbi:MAG: c-type cytochrome [bacterium]